MERTLSIKTPELQWIDSVIIEPTTIQDMYTHKQFSKITITHYFFSFVSSFGSLKAPTFSNIFFNSPDSNSSVTTSHPPTNSPSINNWGYVFQSLIITTYTNTYLTYFRFLATDWLVNILALAKSQPMSHSLETQPIPKCFKIWTTLRLNPHTGFEGVPFIKSITLFSFTIYKWHKQT